MRFADGVLALLLATAAWAGPVLPYQGRLDHSGKPMTGVYNLQFSLYDAPSGGTQFWSDTFNGVNVVAGAFSVKLGSGVAIDPNVLRGRTLYVAIAVEGPGETSFTTLAGRQQLLTTPYAAGSQQDFAVSGNLAVSTGRPDGGAVFTVTGDGGTALVTVSSAAQSLSVDSQSITSTGQLNLQPNGQSVQLGGSAGVTGNLVVNGAVSANNIGKKIYDSAGLVGLPLSFQLDLTNPHTFRIFIDGIVYSATTDNALELRMAGATSGYQSQIYWLGGGQSYTNKNDGMIVMWNFDRALATFNNTLTLTMAINPSTFACTGASLAGNWSFGEHGGGNYFFGLTGGTICTATPNPVTFSLVNSGINPVWSVHVVVYELPN
jgi:hypothetical protein